MRALGQSLEQPAGGIYFLNSWLSMPLYLKHVKGLNIAGSTSLPAFALISGTLSSTAFALDVNVE